MNPQFIVVHLSYGSHVKRRVDSNFQVYKGVLLPFWMRKKGKMKVEIMVSFRSHFWRPKRVSRTLNVYGKLSEIKNTCL
jgi:hypothetical protein